METQGHKSTIYWNWTVLFQIVSWWEQNYWPILWAGSDYKILSYRFIYWLLLPSFIKKFAIDEQAEPLLSDFQNFQLILTWYKDLNVPLKDYLNSKWYKLLWVQNMSSKKIERKNKFWLEIDSWKIKNQFIKNMKKRKLIFWFILWREYKFALIVAEHNYLRIDFCSKVRAALEKKP